MAENPNRSNVQHLSAHHSCALCRRRKVKCDKQNPCSYCVRHSVNCVPAVPTVSRPRKKRYPEAELLARLRKYEGALKSYGADIDAILNDQTPLTYYSHRSLPSETESSTSPSALGPLHHNLPSVSTFHEADATISKRNESSDRISTENDLEQDLILSAYDAGLHEDDSALLPDRVLSPNLAELHPGPAQIFHLWQVFLDTVHPLLKIIHAPSLQKEITKRAFNLHSASTAFHALLQAIYTIAVTSISEEHCAAIFNERKSTLVRRYANGTRLALKQAGLLVSTDITVLQAYVLYLYAIMGAIHSHCLVRLTGLTERSAKASGLHRPFQGQGLSVLDIEMRRRVWWQIVLLDTRAAELSASGTSILSCDWNVSLPKNVNENDIMVDVDTLPENVEGATDMIFCLMRCEMAEFMRHMRSQKQTDFRWNEFGDLSESLAHKLNVIELFEKHIRTRYLDRCDPAIPLHILTRYYALHYLSKMRIVAYRTLSYPDRPLSRDGMAERQEKLMRVCIEVIKEYNQCATNKLVQDFAWFSASCFPFLAYVHLFFNLRNRTNGDLVEEAWHVLTDWNTTSRWVSTSSLSPIGVCDEAVQRAFAKLSLAAWNARRLAQSNTDLEEPDLITRMRDILADDTPQRKAPLQTTAEASEAVNANITLPKVQDPVHVHSNGMLRASNQSITVQSPEARMPDFSDLFFNYDPTLGEMDWETLLSFEGS